MAATSTGTGRPTRDAGLLGSALVTGAALLVALVVVVRTDRRTRLRLEADLRRREHHALELNDSVLQGLVVAKLALDLDEGATARSALDSSIESTGRIITDLLATGHDPHPLVRSVPADLRTPVGGDRVSAAVPPDAPDATNAQDASGSADAAVPARVVIIDDTADLRDLLRLALTRGGMSVVGEAGDGAAGIEAVRRTRPDLVLLDLAMPVLDGMTALPRIRALVPQSRIVVLSGFDGGELAGNAIAAGADAYLQKGMSLVRMLTRLREILAADAPAAGSALPAVRRAPTRPAEAGPRHDALALAPFGVIEVAAAPPYRVLAVNPYAGSLLPALPLPGTPLRAVAPDLADLAAGGPDGTGAPFDAQLGNRAGTVTVRRTEGSLFLYFQPCDDEVGLLRTAIATTAHEIRGPVAVLSALAETVGDAAAGGAPLDDEHQLRLVASIARQARMLDGITADLLTAAQFQRGTLRVTPLAVAPAAVARSVVDDRHLERTVRIEEHDQRAVLADPLRLAQMLGNLLGNAHKYGRPPVVVRIRPAADSAMVRIEVEDAGDGVPGDFRDQLFREFTRGAGPAVAGTGLGLHVVRTLALAQGGHVDYAPADAGGALFGITIPAVD